MIKTRHDLKKYIDYEKKLYISQIKKDKFINKLVSEPRPVIWKYVKLLRYTEYYYNMKKTFYRDIMYLFYRRRKNILGRKLGIEIWENSFDMGLNIWHSHGIVVNGKVRVGKNCVLHGNNCLGNKGFDNNCPIIGDNVDIGVNANIVGNVKIGNHVIVAGNSFVNKSFDEDGIVIGGVPAKRIK